MMGFVVGPSRGGKTTLLNRVLPEFPSVELLDLDAEENRSVGLLLSGGTQTGGWQGRWLRDEARLRDPASRSVASHVLVDVGAGSLQTPEGRQYFINRGPHTIAVVAPLEVVLRRHQGRDREELRCTEYSPERQAVYQAARFQVDSSTDVEASVAAFRHSLRELLGSAG